MIDINGNAAYTAMHRPAKSNIVRWWCVALRACATYFRVAGARPQCGAAMLAMCHGAMFAMKPRYLFACYGLHALVPKHITTNITHSHKTIHTDWSYPAAMCHGLPWVHFHQWRPVYEKRYFFSCCWLRASTLKKKQLTSRITNQELLYITIYSMVPARLLASQH